MICDKIFYIFEILMITCFGISWPISVYKTLKAKSANGKSCTFSIVIIAGYVFGSIGKLMQLQQLPNTTFLFWLTFAVYIVNLIVVTFDTFVTAYYKYWKK